MFTKIVSSTILFGCLSSVALAATPGKTLVQIAVDAKFSDKNIVFIVENPLTSSPESIGLYKAGGNLIVSRHVESIVDSKDQPIPEKITAYVTDSKTSKAVYYQSRDNFNFKNGQIISVSFPEMFE